MATATWTVVEFLENGCVEAVPSNWIEGQVCYWPPLQQSRLMTAIKRLHPRRSSWSQHAVKLFRNSTFDNYKNARCKAKAADHTSDLQLEVEQPRRKRPQLLPSNVVVEVNSSEDENIVGTPPQVKRHRNMVTHYSHADSEESLQIAKTVTVHNTEQSSVAGHSTESLETYLLTMKNIENQSHVFRALLTDVLQEVRELKEEVRELKEEVQQLKEEVRQLKEEVRQLKEEVRQLKEEVRQLKEEVRQLKEEVRQLKEEVRQLKEEVRQLKEAGKTIAGGDHRVPFLHRFPLLKFPMNTDEEISIFENILNSGEEFQDSVQELHKIGGENAYQFVKRMLSTLMTNDLALRYSWMGRKGKKPFNKLNLANLVICAAEKGNVTANRRHTETAIQMWLKRAADRIAKTRKEF